MIRVERAKACSHVTTADGDKLPVSAWLVVLGRRSFIFTTYKRPRPPMAPASRTIPMGDTGVNQ
jgi:hypothetical protein